MKEFLGRYLGLGMTDESNLGCGEAEVIISETGLKRRMATGLEIQESDEQPLSDFVPMTREEITAVLQPEQELSQRCAGFKTADNLPILIFMTDPAFFDERYVEGDSALLVRTGGMEEQVGFVNVFMGPAVVARGDFDKAVRELEQANGLPGAVPRLANGGRAPADKR